MFNNSYNRKILCRVLFIVLYFTTVNNHCIAQQRFFDTVSHRIVMDMQGKVSIPGLDRSVSKTLADMQADGTWKDVNYKDNAVTLWSPALHLRRIQDFALAYGHHNSRYVHNETLYNAMIKALQAWNRVDPRCKNWWYNEISCPQLLGQILLLMQASKAPPSSLQDSLLKKMDRGDMYKQTGANKLDVALHSMYSALLTHHIALMDSAINQCFQPVFLTTAPEGLHVDYSYLQHGPQLQIASYGSVFLAGEYKVAAYVRGTPWEMPEEKSKIMAGFFNRLFLNTIRYKYFDFSAMGRGFSRKDSGLAGIIWGMNSNIDLLKRSGAAHSFVDYDDAIKRVSGKVPASYKVNPVHQQFWIGDYTLHVRPDYQFSVRTNSIRTRRTETGNGENLYGRYMSDGATNIQRSGSEYFNIFPIWEYDKVPGVTCRDYPADRPAVNSWEQSGSTNFTGGVSDGLCGANTYSLNFDSVQAKKAWFFFDKQIVCLGTGIKSDTPEPIATTVNQCWSHGNMVVKKSNHGYWQDSIGYYFQPGAHVLFSNAKQTGTWNHINSSQSKDTVSGKVFKLWIEHGVHPQNACYSYAVVPNISARSFLKDSPFLKLKIISNTRAVQAVLNEETDMVQLVFYQPGSVQAGKTKISVNAPCVVMLKKGNTISKELFVADPTHELKTIQVIINSKVINCILPVKEYSGSTAKFTIN